MPHSFWQSLDTRSNHVGPRSRFSWSLSRCCQGSQDDPAALLPTDNPLVARRLSHGLDDRPDRFMAATSCSQYCVRCSRSAVPGWFGLELWRERRLRVIPLVWCEWSPWQSVKCPNAHNWLISFGSLEVICSPSFLDWEARWIRELWKYTGRHCKVRVNRRSMPSHYDKSLVKIPARVTYLTRDDISFPYKMVGSNTGCNSGEIGYAGKIYCIHGYGSNYAFI